MEKVKKWMYMTPNELNRGENSVKGCFTLLLGYTCFIYKWEVRSPTTISPCLCWSSCNRSWIWCCGYFSDYLLRNSHHTVWLHDKIPKNILIEIRLQFRTNCICVLAVEICFVHIICLVGHNFLNACAPILSIDTILEFGAEWRVA